MPSEKKLIATYQTCFQLKALFSPCTLLYLHYYDLSALEYQLAEKISLNPNFFQDTPVVIDLEKIKMTELNFERIKQILLRYHLIPIGIRNGSDEQNEAAALKGLPSLQMGKPTSHHTKTDDSELVNETRMITSPVRSGMQIYAKQSDLVVISSVSPGSEIIADGHIHVYGHLRGRAFAGMQGNKKARIFCRMLDAELVAIAGFYLTKEERPVMRETKDMLQIYLENEKIKIAEL